MSMLFKRIKDWAVSIISFRTGDVIPVDGPSGTAKMSKDDLLKVTAENALAGNIAQGFDPTRTSENSYNAGESVTYNGKTYMFKNPHYGAWNADDVIPFSVDSVVRSIQNLNEIGSFEIELFDKFSFTPNFGTGRIVSSSAYNSYVFDIGTGVVVDNIVVDGFVGIVQTDVFPKHGDVYAEESRNAFTKMTHRYLVVCVDEDFAPTHCVVKARHISPFDNKENFDEKVGFLNKTISSNAFLNQVPSSSVGKFISDITFYNSYVFDVGSDCEFEIVSAGSAFSFSVQTDTFPKNGDSFNCLNRNSTGYTFHRYLTVVVDKSEPDLNIQVKLKGRGLSEKVLKLEQKSNVACETFSSDTLSGIVPSTSSYEASNVYYDSFVFDIGVGKQYSIKVYGADFVLTTQEDSNPQIGDALGSVRDRVTTGVMRKRYLVVCVDKENKSWIGCVVSVLGEGRKKLKALFIGNSVNQDHVMYAPWYLHNEYKDDLDFEIGNFYIASYTIKKYVENCVNGNTPADIYSTAYGTPTWTNVSNTELLADAIESNDWDIISVQGYFNNGVLGPEDMSYLSDLVQFVSDHAIKPFTLAFMIHQTYTAGALARIIDGTKYAVKNNAVRLVFPCGFATEFVKNLWTHSFLTSDDIHNQEGLPCILGGYVVGDVLSRYAGLPSRIMGNEKRMTSQEHSRLNIAGQNGTFQAGTNSQFDQAQIAACKAINAGYGVLSTAQMEMIPEE